MPLWELLLIFSFSYSSLCDATERWAGPVCDKGVSPICSPWPWDLCAAAADGLAAMHRQPSQGFHPATVWGARPPLRKHWALLPGAQYHHGLLEGLWLCGVHEEGLCSPGEVRASGEAAWVTNAVRTLDRGWRSHVSHAALTLSLCGPTTSKHPHRSGFPQCADWHTHSHFLPGWYDCLTHLTWVKCGSKVFFHAECFSIVFLFKRALNRHVCPVYSSHIF